MAERSGEVIVCGASIMKDVWEIRLKDKRQKGRLEDERLRRSALEKINQDWQARVSYKIKTQKRLERKAKPLEESSRQTLKVKQMNPSSPQVFQSSRAQRQADSTKTTKVNKLALLHRLNESCPDLMVWAKSWKFSQPLEETKETCYGSDWGKSWKFHKLQPNSDGKPWFDLEFDHNNIMSTNGILFLCERLGKALYTHHLHLEISDPGWEKSWVFKQKRAEDRAIESWLTCNKFYNLWESHHLDDSEWNNSWMSTKPSNDFIQPISNGENQKKDDGQSELPLNTSWMYFKKDLHIKFETSAHSGWSQSWRVSKTKTEQVKKSISSQAKMLEEPLHFNFCNVIMSLSGEMRHTILRSSSLHAGHKHSPEWEKSWVTVKNQSEYKEETKKVGNTENNPMEEPPQTECQRVKFEVLNLPKRQKSHEISNLLEQQKRDTNWKDSWKMLKHQRKEQRGQRNQRCPPVLLSPTLQTSEWVNSSKFTNLTLNQDINLWQQGWSTSIQLRPNRRVPGVFDENVANNGPLGVQGWSESWRSKRHQQHLERQNAGASMGSVMDWQQSWQLPSNQHCHERPSMMEWMGSWRFSGENWVDLRPKNTSVKMKVGNQVYRTSHKWTLRERFPSELWDDAWRIKKRSDGTGSHDLITSEVLDWDNSWTFTGADFYRRHGDHYLNVKLSSRMPNAVESESESEWGRSWKISNPQPPRNIGVWMHAKPKSFTEQDVLLRTRAKHNNLLSALPGKLKICGTSWRFTKSNQAFNSPADESLINTTTKIRKHKYTYIDKHKPQQKRWNDACKLSKTQPRPKRDDRHKSDKDECEDGQGMFPEWIESWRFSKSLADMFVSLTDWKNSWKFLLDPYVPLNGPRIIKAVLLESLGSFADTRRVCLPQLGRVSGVVAEPSDEIRRVRGSLSRREYTSVGVRLLTQGTVCFYPLEEQETSLKLKTSGQSFTCVRSDRMNTRQNMLHMQPEDSDLQSSYGVMSVAAEVSGGRY
ncbi:hypothetical protein E1301_Tti000056 [Triplophysa tibetana]|uniref:Uncharacterized protein n=1 Tax=Triplophysa tibetana TaxID=1572043 RepID=A0A5A9N2P6_9TELE|nr:hypothetical protein E1301_Tti000056 [Triplophysa tibetana]